jgi:8-oxo-dGTP diphosphatase
MKAVKIDYNKKWIPYENRVEFYLDENKEIFDAPVTTVHGFFFDESDRLLMVRHKRRGWEIPGGHIEASETSREAMHRELFEEAQVKSEKLHCLGHLKKIATGEKPDLCSYPFPLSYCLFYAGRITEIEKFVGDNSIVDYQFVETAKARAYSWIQAYEDYLNASLALVAL